MATYVFTFPAAAAGKAVTVRDAGGSTVDSGTAGSASGVQGSCTYSADLPVGSYVAEAVDASIFFTSRAPGVLDVTGAATAQAEFVADADDTDAASVAAAVDALRDALIAAGLMAAE